MTYITAIAIISILWGVAEILRKLSAGGTDSRLLSVTFNLGAFVAPFIWLVMAYLKKETIATGAKSIALSTLGGALVGIGCVVLFDVLSKNVSTSVTLGLVHVLTILVLIVGSVIFLSDQLNLKVVLGFALSLAGLFLLTTK